MILPMSFWFNILNHKIMAKRKKEENEAIKDQEVNTAEATVETNEETAAEEQVELSPEEKMQAEISDLNDKHIRLFAEFENYKRRTAREKLEMMKNASESLCRSLLSVLDDFDRAKKFGSEESDVIKVREGFELIGHKLFEVLKREGLEPLESAIGNVLDTELHEAITQIPAPSDDLKGKIVDEVETGYKLNDKIIRHTKVVVGQL
ncbi:MAG: molecular chaperone GrpE [Candidatus Azotimanducaceae bacterium]|jgi:molecular chaperone GrpE